MKRSGKEKPIWVVIHICMETTLRISPYSYLYLKLAKTLCFSYYLYVFSSTKSEKKREEQVLPGNGRAGEVAQIM
jgi:hypothetical protein